MVDISGLWHWAFMEYCVLTIFRILVITCNDGFGYHTSMQILIWKSYLKESWLFCPFLRQMKFTVLDSIKLLMVPVLTMCLLTWCFNYKRRWTQCHMQKSWIFYLFESWPSMMSLTPSLKGVSETQLAMVFKDVHTRGTLFLSWYRRASCYLLVRKNCWRV